MFYFDPIMSLNGSQLVESMEFSGAGFRWKWNVFYLSNDNSKELKEFEYMILLEWHLLLQIHH